MTQLSVPLELPQIDAAGRLHERLAQWQLSDTALTRLADRFPGFGREETLLKVVAINGLYGTNVYAQVRMADHICNTLRGSDLDHSGPKLVDQMACLPKAEGQHTPRRYVSFASKFAHFFLDRDRFPIKDSYAELMVRYHLGRSNYVKNQPGVYLEFVANIQRLMQLSGLECSSRELDRYLWLTGLYRQWRKQIDSKINREVAMLFADESAQVVRDLQLLVGKE